VGERERGGKGEIGRRKEGGGRRGGAREGKGWEVRTYNNLCFCIQTV